MYPLGQWVGWVVCRGCRIGGRGAQHYWAGLGALINKCQQRGKQHCGCRITVFWQLGGMGADSGGEILYLGSPNLITPNAAFSAPQWGRDGMDWLGALWMTFQLLCSIISTSSKIAFGCSFSSLGLLGAIFSRKNTHMGRYNIFTFIAPFPARWGRREWMDGPHSIWMTLPFWEGFGLTNNYLFLSQLFSSLLLSAFVEL
jgi:hypothetical protein